ncbi:hypothetical protein KSF73_12900 [Burkholderiaceae bacterium DAT-1]|nr:hypothetical protein [Burkholderiaceae bacterium DAT-1]
MKEAVALCKASYVDGVRMAVATSHVYPARWDNRAPSLRPVFEQLKQAIGEAGIPLELRMGGEVRFGDDILPLLDKEEIPFLGHDGKYHVMLLEFPDAGIPVGSDALVRHLLGRGIRPLIAHPERNEAVKAKPERLYPFLDIGCWVQLTAGSVLGQFGKTAKSVAFKLMEMDAVNVLASDCHNLEYRPPNMGEACKVIVKQFGADYCDVLVNRNPARIAGIAA